MLATVGEEWIYHLAKDQCISDLGRLGWQEAICTGGHWPRPRLLRWHFGGRFPWSNLRRLKRSSGPTTVLAGGRRLCGSTRAACCRARRGVAGFAAWAGPKQSRSSGGESSVRFPLQTLLALTAALIESWAKVDWFGFVLPVVSAQSGVHVSTSQCRSGLRLSCVISCWHCTIKTRTCRFASLGEYCVALTFCFCSC